MANIRKVAEIVKDVLTNRVKARDNDNVLICFVINEYGKEQAKKDGIGFNWNSPFVCIMKAIDEGKAPTLESITRARRKCQEIYPALRGSTYVADIKLEKTAEYKSFAKDKRV